MKARSAPNCNQRGLYLQWSKTNEKKIVPCTSDETIHYEPLKWFQVITLKDKFILPKFEYSNQQKGVNWSKPIFEHHVHTFNAALLYFQANVRNFCAGYVCINILLLLSMLTVIQKILVLLIELQDSEWHLV